MRVRFLLDENLSPRLRRAVRRHNPAIDVIRVGDFTAPPLGAPDPSILVYLAQANRLLITDNRASMPAHHAAHLADGRHHWGILRIRAKTPFGRLVDEMLLIWEASEAEEWIDRFGWLPL